MTAEKIIISFFAILIGVVATGAAFYFYQTTKVVPPSQVKTLTVKPTLVVTPPLSSVFLSIDSPKNEEVTDSKTITVSGKTSSDAVVVVSSATSDQVFRPAGNGNFSSSITIEDGANQIEITAIAPNGEEAKSTKTITFSTETF